MKSHSHMRKSAGAVLGLIAGTIIIIFIIGVFLYFAGVFVGGNHQLNKASDAGILNAARQALVQPAVSLNDPSLVAAGSLPYSDFAVAKGDGTYFIADQTAGGYPAIDLLTYNRCAAQAVLVSTQATAIGSQTSRQHAQQVCLAVWYLGQALQNKFSSGSLDNFYDTEAAANSLSLIGLGNKTEVTRESSLTPAYIGAGRPSNIYFYPDVLNPYNGLPNWAATLPSTLAGYGIPEAKLGGEARPDAAKVAAGDHYFPAGEQIYYAAGYTPITVMPGQKEASIVAFVPIGPQHFAHAIDRERADAGATPPSVLTTLPPNAFKAKAMTKIAFDGKSETGGGNTFVNAVSCAMVGCGGQDYPACIPGGFIRVANLPDMVGMGNLPLGPVPAANEANSVDGSSFILNNEGLGIGSQGVQEIYVLWPAPKSGGVLDVNHCGFGLGANGLAAVKNLIAFNKSNNQSNQTDIIATSSGVFYHDPNKDPFKSPNASQLLAAGQNPNITSLRQGPTTSTPLSAEVAFGVKGYPVPTDYLTISSDVISGSNLKTAGGVTVPYSLVSQALFDVASLNIGNGMPKGEVVPVPANHEGWTQIEYLKYKVLMAFKQDFKKGKFQIPASLLNQIPRAGGVPLETGMKNYAWFKNGKQVKVATPNNVGKGIPSPPQFAHFDTPFNYISEIDTVIKHTGYERGQLTLDNFYGEIINQLRLINPKWSEEDLYAALQSAPLKMGQLMYLRDDGTGKLVLTANCPQDPGYAHLQVEGFQAGASNINQAAWFSTSNAQSLPVMGEYINTALDGSPTAYKADANVEKQMWRNQSGGFKVKLIAVLYKSSGYNNLVGEINFASSTATPPTTMNFSNPN